MARETTAGLVLHSNFARHYAAAHRELAIGHAERTMEHLAVAKELAATHWAGLEEHLAQREGAEY